MSAPFSIGETFDSIRSALGDYIEATYHISNPTLIRRRQGLLSRPEVIYQKPFIESTPKYKSGAKFEEVLGLNPAAQDIMQCLSAPSKDRVLFNPPYEHQQLAIEQSLVRDRSLVVVTGTGSGKTECFLLPMLGKLATEAATNPATFKTPAVRCLVLYPMNALVNDQLGRLRNLFGNPTAIQLFTTWAGRPARFARYTNRTLYPGVRTRDKDQRRLKPIHEYYVANLLAERDPTSSNHESAAKLVHELRLRGKFPTKSDLVSWYGRDGEHWQRGGQFVRCVTEPGDSELLTRHEVISAPPDILVTNYSMLEYMLMRPLEAPVFEQTSRWLADNPNERFLLVIDEAHLYRGAAGAEVALLIRRLRARLGIEADRLQVICTSASFNEKENARTFSAELSGKQPEDFEVIEGKLAYVTDAEPGEVTHAETLAAIKLEELYSADSDAARLRVVEPLLSLRGVASREGIERSLYEALIDYPPLGLLINTIMGKALPADELGEIVYPGVQSTIAAKAVTSLLALGSIARASESEPGLIPARVHCFFRGFAGLWICLNPSCPSDENGRDEDPGGALYSQPRSQCDHCKSRVLELFTCRNCGTAYARAYTDNIEDPKFLWSEQGEAFLDSSGNFIPKLECLDILLEEPVELEKVEPVLIDLDTGRLNPKQEEARRTRIVYLKKDRTSPFVEDSDADTVPASEVSAGEFKPCGVCDQTANFGRTYVQDHQTKGDQPFQAIVNAQLQAQPPNLTSRTSFAPLRGRKVLIFSDSRQVAARLAPRIQTYSLQDCVRPLLLYGFRELYRIPNVAQLTSLEMSVLAVVLAATKLEIQPRYELRASETFTLEKDVKEAVRTGAFDNPLLLMPLLLTAQSTQIPESLAELIFETIWSKYQGLYALALASIRETAATHPQLAALPPIPSIAETPEERMDLVRVWLFTVRDKGTWFRGFPPEWAGTKVRGFSFPPFKLAKDWPQAAKRIFNNDWKPILESTFFEQVANGKLRLRGDRLALELEGAWLVCKRCRINQPPSGVIDVCQACGSAEIEALDPLVDAAFRARKGYYRRPSELALGPEEEAPFAIVAAEHTAQLNSAQATDVFSKSEENELLFQDVELGPDEHGRPHTAIDVLSCTTTMEVGIDIGSLSGVALRNLPPSRANYQQRAGRAGRRGNAVASVVSFGSADSHDEHYFRNPAEMVSGPVLDPFLTLSNIELVRRHVTAYLLQKYLQHKISGGQADLEDRALFEVLGSVASFKSPTGFFNIFEFEGWLTENLIPLRQSISEWIPTEIAPDESQELLDDLVQGTLGPIRNAIQDETDIENADGVGLAEEPRELGDERGGATDSSNLLDRLLEKGVLPRYAFPTDVATFHIFNPHSSTYTPEFLFTPSQGLPTALNQYAPGKEVWVSGRKYISGAIYSPYRNERRTAWEQSRLYFECSHCHFSFTKPSSVGRDYIPGVCDACKHLNTFQVGQKWFRPPGFAHPVFLPERTSTDELPQPSFATHAKLAAPAKAARWKEVNPRCSLYYDRDELLVTNRGPADDGYNYCTICGLISPVTGAGTLINAVGSHKKPSLDRHPDCPGNRTASGVVLGTHFTTDILLISFRLDAPLQLRPGLISTRVALRTASEALSKAAATILQVEPAEIAAEFRPALNGLGGEGRDVEIYLYDTLPGGAGFARHVSTQGQELLETALNLLENCPASCDSSCYRCLRSFKNKFEHGLLDRQVGAALLRYVIRGETPRIADGRLSKLKQMLHADLSRQDVPGLAVLTDLEVEVLGVGTTVAPILVDVNGRKTIIDFESALTPDYTFDPVLADIQSFSNKYDYLRVSEATIQRNLPSLTAGLLANLGVHV